MTPLDLVSDCRLRMDDTGGDTGTVPTGFTYYWESDDRGCLVKNEEWIRYLNNAHREIAVRTNCYRDSAENEICQIKVKHNVRLYDIDPRILTIEDVRLASTGMSLVKTALRDYQLTYNAYNVTAAAPTHYLEENRPFRITLYPTPFLQTSPLPDPLPASIDTLYLTVYRLPLDELTWAGRTGELDEPTESMREMMVQGALMLAYQKRDADTGDVNRQKFHQQEFERLVGLPVDFKTLENRRYSANLDIGIRPSPYVPRVKGTRRWYQNELE
jgi:hypothetical protein